MQFPNGALVNLERTIMIGTRLATFSLAVPPPESTFETLPQIAAPGDGSSFVVDVSIVGRCRFFQVHPLPIAHAHPPSPWP